MQLFNPLIEVCLLSRLAREGGILLHASGLSLCEQGYVFTGPSGAGKSTIAELFADRGATVLSDERVIVRMRDTGFVLFGTPWVGSGQYAANASAPMTALYCIQHGQERHRIDTLKPSTVVTRMLQQAFLPHWDCAGVETTLEVLTSLTRTMPCRSLAFLNQLDIVDFFAQSLIGASHGRHMKQLDADTFLAELSWKSRQRRHPDSVTFELTYGCNLRCVHCFNPTHRALPQELTTREIQAILINWRNSAYSP